MIKFIKNTVNIVNFILLNANFIIGKNFARLYYF